jgi:hypothetical protein
VNLRNTNQIAEIDPSTDAVVNRYPVQGCEFNHGMALDSEHHRAFLLCGKNRTMTVFALDTHHAIAHLPLPPGADVVKFDAGLRRIYAATGFIAVYQESDAQRRMSFGVLFRITEQTVIFEKSKTSRSRRWYTALQ